ncbi:MAG: DUF5916 domain-containing protein [Bacteroidota bacterium]
MLRGLLLAFLAFGALSAHAQSVVDLPRLNDKPVQIDGMSDEAAWQTIETLPLTTYEPVFGAEPTERTEIKVAYDDNFLYVAGQLYCKTTATMRGNSLYRDRYSGDDVFAIVLDTFNDNENALWFFVNPEGTRFDLAVSNDANSGGGSPFGGVVNSSWNTYWDAAVVQNDEGWFAEMRIPYSSLGFQNTGDEVTMGMSVYRFIATANERHMYPAVSPDYNLGFAKPSQMQDVRLKNVSSRKPLYLTPYVSGGVGSINELNTDETAYVFSSSTQRDVGLDLKYNVTSNLTLDVTVNTDFAQVEADDQQVNLTRFSLFQPEKRQFFQERAGIFAFQTGRNDRLFFSRRIGLNDDNEPVRILGGTRMVGRIGSWDVGLIDMQTASSDDLPAENFGVLRLRRRVLNPVSYAGGIFTSRLGGDGSYNLTYGADATLNLRGDDFLVMKWGQTAEQANNAFNFVDASVFRVQFQRQRQEGFTFNSGITRSGADYNPGMGFVTRTDFTQSFLRLGYGHFNSDASALRQTTPDVFGIVATRNGDGSVESVRTGAGLEFDYKSGAGLSIEYTVRYEDLTEALEFPGDTEVPVGGYWFSGLDARYGMANGLLFRTEFEGSLQTFYDGWRFDAGVGPRWNVSPHLELSTEYSLNLVRFPERDNGFDAHIVRFRAQTVLNTKVSLNTFVQYSNVADLISANVRFRYNFREGNDLWLVYNEGLNTARSGRDLAVPLSDARTIVFKYTYTFDV